MWQGTEASNYSHESESSQKSKDLTLFFIALGLRCCTGLSLVVSSGGYSLLWCIGFSLRWFLLLWSMGSRCMGLSSCVVQAQ